MSRQDISPENQIAAVAAGDIEAYYNSNTRRFLNFGGSGDVAAIHRAIWAPDVTDKAAAFNYLNLCVAEAIAPCISQSGYDEQGLQAIASVTRSRVLDLGCGVGGTATWLAKMLDVHVTGITISSTQCELATKRAERLGLHQHCQFLQADFAAMPDLEAMSAAYAIESFVHVSDADSFFAMAARQIKRGGRLVICDDFLAANNCAEAEYWIGRFRRGWHLNNLVTPEQTVDAAGRHGFKLIAADDLSAYTRAFNPVLLAVVSQITRLPVPGAYWHNLSGGSALQICLKRGWTQYRVLVLEYT